MLKFFVNSFYPKIVSRHFDILGKILPSPTTYKFILKGSNSLTCCDLYLNFIAIILFSNFGNPLIDYRKISCFAFKQHRFNAVRENRTRYESRPFVFNHSVFRGNKQNEKTIFFAVSTSKRTGNIKTIRTLKSVHEYLYVSARKYVNCDRIQWSGEISGERGIFFFFSMEGFIDIKNIVPLSSSHQFKCLFRINFSSTSVARYYRTFYIKHNVYTVINLAQ